MQINSSNVAMKSTPLPPAALPVTLLVRLRLRDSVALLLLHRGGEAPEGAPPEGPPERRDSLLWPVAPERQSP